MTNEQIQRGIRELEYQTGRDRDSGVLNSELLSVLEAMKETPEDKIKEMERHDAMMLRGMKEPESSKMEHSEVDEKHHIMEEAKPETYMCTHCDEELRVGECCPCRA